MSDLLTAHVGSRGRLPSTSLLMADDVLGQTSRIRAVRGTNAPMTP